MNAERLLALYEQVAEAPDAVPRLRRFVLDLAVRGKLAPQDSGDEPASELLKRIAAEKARLVKAGEIRKPKALPPVDEQPFALPPNWRWVRIREATSDRGQRVPDGDFTYIDVTAINKEAGVVAEPNVLAKDEAPSRARKIAAIGDVLYSCVRPYLLNVAVIDKEFEPAPIASTAFAVLNGHGLVLPWYLWIALRSPFMVECVEENQRGQAYPAINDKDFSLLPFPLPPLAEQRRIVAKVEELMALLDRLEVARTAREATRDRLTAASLARLTAPDTEASEGEPGKVGTGFPSGSATSKDSFPANAHFVLKTLPALTTRPDQIKPLRQTILNLAVRGKLVEGADGELATVGEYRKLQNGYAFKSGWFAKSGMRLLRNANIGHGEIHWDETVYLPEDRVAEFERFRLQKGDIVLTLDRPFIVTGTKVARVTEADLPSLLLQRVGRFVETADGLADDYLFLWINSPHFNDQIDPGRSNGVPHISSKQVEAAEIYVPPLAEQNRIVAKVDALMALCARLEAALTTADATRARLLEAILHEALEPAARAVKEAAE
ncbi:MAG: restriction endonuclease subunit S [Pseudomonadota bacterium]